MLKIWKCSWRRKQPEFSAHLWMTLPHWSFSSASFICVNSSLITFIWTFILSTFILLAIGRLMIGCYLSSTWKWKKIMLLYHVLLLHWLQKLFKNLLVIYEMIMTSNLTEQYIEKEIILIWLEGWIYDVG